MLLMQVAYAVAYTVAYAVVAPATTNYCVSNYTGALPCTLAW